MRVGTSKNRPTSTQKVRKHSKLQKTRGKNVPQTPFCKKTEFLVDFGTPGGAKRQKFISAPAFHPGLFFAYFSFTNEVSLIFCIFTIWNRILHPICPILHKSSKEIRRHCTKFCCTKSCWGVSLPTLHFAHKLLARHCPGRLLGTVQDVCTALSGTFARHCPGRLLGVVRDVCLALSGTVARTFARRCPGRLPGVVRTFARRCPGRLPGVVRNVCPALSRTFARRCPGRLPGIVRDVCPALSGAFAWQ